MTMEITSYGDGGWKVTLVAAILIFMQLLAISGRIISRSMKKASLAVDDYFLILGTVSRDFASLFVSCLVDMKPGLFLHPLCPCNDMYVP